MKKIYLSLVLALSFTLISASSFAVSFPSSSTLPVKGGDPEATAKAALENFKNLSHKEKKALYKDAKKAFKELKAESKAKKEPIGSVAAQVIVAILLPPLGIYLHEGEINSKFWIGLLLTLLFYLPGLIYALVVILGDDKK